MQLAVKNYVIQTKVMGTPQLRFGALGERHLNCHAVVPTCTTAWQNYYRYRCKIKGMNESLKVVK